MIAYTYTLVLRNTIYTCRNIPEVSNIINEEIGFNIVSVDTIGNYLTRPHAASKKIFGKLVELTREQRHGRFRKRKPQPVAAD